MRKSIWGISWVLAALAISFSAGAEDYVGSEKCFTCHMEQYNDWQASGHPWKLRTAEEARSAKLPLPPGYTWEDISYVIGGANKKARYIDKKGYIITTAKDGSEAKTQYNLEDGSWAFYHKGEKKPYSCGPCHMTSYSSEGHQNNLEGIVGTWAEDGIGCEECHGPGGEHLRKPSKKTIAIDRSAESCGKCHQRGGIGPEPPAKGGFIRHHEQINELKAGVHKNLLCTTCHNPHQRAILAKDNCGTCHAAANRSFAENIHAKAGLTCKNCHMPKAAKSAIAPASYIGDVRTHLFKINIDPEAEMFKTIEEKGKKSTIAKGFVTLDFACLSCHGSRDRAWAAQHAKEIHKP